MVVRVLLVMVLVGGCRAQDKAEEMVGDVAETAGGTRGKIDGVVDRAVDLAGKARDKVGDAVGMAAKAKAELDKVYRSTHAYDLDVEDASAEATRAHEAQLATLPSVAVGDVRVGYEEDSKLSLRGTAYAKHFRASWRRGDKIVRVSFYTKEEIDALAFAALVEKLVPAVESAL